jgi:glycosyltransferase involved in cell wall biosynthesis
LRVVFVTSVFEQTDTGPATYARYLWAELRDDPDIEFHLVAPSVSETHPRIHVSGDGVGSLELYRRLQQTARTVVERLPANLVIHGNSTHSMARLLDYSSRMIVQVNDYETALAPRSVPLMIFRRRVRQAASTSWRYVQERRVLRRVRLALCNSRFTAEAVRRSYGLSDDRCAVLHKAVDTSAFSRPALVPGRAQSATSTGPIVLFVGTDWRRKGLDVLIEAFARLGPAFASASLWVVGPSPDDTELGALLKRAQLGERALILGQAARSEVAEYLWRSDVFVLPSRREALGVAVLEAMAAGVPVIATEVGGIPEIIRSSTEGLLVRPDDVGQLTDALHLVLEDASLRQSLSSTGHHRAEDFSVGAMVAGLREIYWAQATDGTGNR